MSHDRTHEGNLDLKAKKASIYELKQPTTLFRLACAEPEIRNWLKKGLEQDQHSFVVGVRTFHDASVSRTAGQGTSSGAGIDIPVGEIVKANTGVSTGDTLDVTASVGKSGNKGIEESYETKGEYIYAICYRKVVLRTRLISEATLGRDNVWRMYSDDRDSGPVKFEVCEADLEDSDFTTEAADDAAASENNVEQYFSWSDTSSQCPLALCSSQEMNTCCMAFKTTDDGEVLVFGTDFGATRSCK